MFKNFGCAALPKKLKWSYVSQSVLVCCSPLYTWLPFRIMRNINWVVWTWKSTLACFTKLTTLLLRTQVTQPFALSLIYFLAVRTFKKSFSKLLQAAKYWKAKNLVDSLTLGTLDQKRDRELALKYKIALLFQLLKRHFCSYLCLTWHQTTSCHSVFPLCHYHKESFCLFVWFFVFLFWLFFFPYPSASFMDERSPNGYRFSELHKERRQW